jgi:hypothetical protein
MTNFEVDPFSAAQIHFVKPRGVKNANVFKILIHIEVVEDLMFYHYPREELLADGKVSWREFVWHLGKPGGEIVEDKLMLPTRYCGPQSEPRWCFEDDDGNNRNQKRLRSCGFMGRVTRWIDGRGRPKNRAVEGHGSGWFAGESSRGRRAPQPEMSPPGDKENDRSLQDAQWDSSHQQLYNSSQELFNTSDVIVITPHLEGARAHHITHQCSEVIEIIPQPLPDLAQQNTILYSRPDATQNHLTQPADHSFIPKVVSEGGGGRERERERERESPL